MIGCNTPRQSFFVLTNGRQIEMKSASFRVCPKSRTEFVIPVIEGKSTRLSLNKRRVEPLYTAPRPAYAWHTDVAGPFSVRTPEGHNQFRLLVCGHSRLRKGELISTTADFHIAWEQHVAAVETDLGRTSIVAQLISDSASYYDSDALDQYNLKRVLPISTRLPTLRG
jgi:hypothetical protein